MCSASGCDLFSYGTIRVGTRGFVCRACLPYVNDVKPSATEHRPAPKQTRKAKKGKCYCFQ